MGVWIETPIPSSRASSISSHPSWVCGLKLLRLSVLSVHEVTPFVGVWIETWLVSAPMHRCAVTPFVGVWIETFLSRNHLLVCMVTPFVGVWIETALPQSHSAGTTVTPFVGVWIETYNYDRP